MLKELNFIITLSPEQQDRLRVVAFKEKGRVTGFVAQYETLIGQDWRQIVRYDTAHGFAHKDIIHPNGEVVKQPLPLLTLIRRSHLPLRTLKRHGGGTEKRSRRN